MQFMYTLPPHIEIILLYCGRVLIGMSLGCSDCCVLSILIFWFHKAHGNKSFAATCLYIGTILALIMPRLCVDAMHSLLSQSYAFVMPIVLNLLDLAVICGELREEW
eukprot:406407_1